MVLFPMNSKIFRVSNMYEKEGGRLLNRKLEKLPDSHKRHTFNQVFFKTISIIFNNKAFLLPHPTIERFLVKLNNLIQRMLI